MTKENIELYYETCERFERGEVSRVHWTAVCEFILEEIMEEHKDVFVRLKERE